MIKQFFTLIIRNILKDKIFSVINFTNLVVGFATFLLLSLFVFEHFNWDKQNVYYDRVYRLQLFMDQEANANKHTTSVTAALARHELVNMPEVEKVALIHDVGDNNKNGIFLSADKKNQVLTRYGYFADPTIFDIMTFKPLEGDLRSALDRPFSIVLSKTVADKLFPLGNAIGKIVYGENKVIFTVTGVYADRSQHSEWIPSYLVSMCSFGPITNFKDYEQNYFAYSFGTYVLLKEHADYQAVNKKIYDALKNYRKEHHPYLRPMSKIHLYGNFNNSFYIVLGLFSFIALLILILAAINFINLQTANAANRIREIGIKKAIGFTKTNLMTQFVMESVVTNLFASMLALIIAQLFIPVFNQIIGTEALTSIFSNWSIIVFFVAVAILTGLLSGLYPALVISRYNPIKALKQRYLQVEYSGLSLKNVLVTVQFSISLFLLIVSFIIYKQTDYMMNGDLGFNPKNMVYANIGTNKKVSFDMIRQRLVRHPEIVDACFSDYIPFIIPGGDDLNWDEGNQNEKVFVRFYNISTHFFSTYEIKIKGGRPFSADFQGDANKCLINETTAKIFRWDKPIGQIMRTYNNKYEVVGVINDYIAQSMLNEQEPHMYRLMNDTAAKSGIFTVRFQPGSEKNSRQIIRDEFSQIFPDDAFEFNDFQSLIRNENALKYFVIFRNTAIFFSILTIIISSIGLFGLVMFFTRQKMKEIGLRKVFGFSFGSLYLTMSKGFVKLLTISIIIAWPLAYYVYKTMPGARHYPLSANEFILATLIIMVVAILTISYQIIKASRSNPIEVLKEE